MIIDNKIDSLPPVVKIMSIIPTTFAIGFIYFEVWILGIPILVLVLMGITAQQRVKVDFDNKLIKNYYRILWIGFGKWVPLKEFHLLSITPERTIYRETNYSWNPNNVGANMYEFGNTTSVLSLKIDNRNKYVIAKGGFKRILKLAQLISNKTQKDIFDCTVKEPKLIKYKDIIHQ